MDRQSTDLPSLTTLNERTSGQISPQNPASDLAKVLPLGARIEVRGEDFIVTGHGTDAETGAHYLLARGLSELVEGRTFAFDPDIDLGMHIINPAETSLVLDTSMDFREMRLSVESALRTAPLASERITISRGGAYKLHDYQTLPARKALRLPRPRMLIADAVGLGKTIEIGIILTELIRRGQGKRILICALKSILAQFQEEMWNRFALPFVRLDSLGVSAIQSELPLGKNPFDYYDRSIISIDTLKNHARYRNSLERSYWDIIVIDECHTVANDSSERGSLAQLLAQRCNSLILASATPHNGKKEVFANLVRMLDPIAIPRSGDFTAKDIEPYCVRRTKNSPEVRSSSVKSQFPDRKLVPLDFDLSPSEEEFLALQHRVFRRDADDAVGSKRKGRDADPFFALTLFKGYLSSPQAALESLEKRYAKGSESPTDADGEPITEAHLEQIRQLRQLLEGIIARQEDTRYTAFRTELKRIWGDDSQERIVVFAERKATLSMLQEHLKRDFKLRDEQIILFDGSLSDTEQEERIANFGMADSPYRVFLSSEAGSQGVNLHYHCHRMFNYDLPWSIITIEQRNGRIDRFGQQETPYIYYLVGHSRQSDLQSDLRIIENLQRKEDEVHKALGDGASVLKLFNEASEVKATEEALRSGNENFLEEAANEAADEDYLDWGDFASTGTEAGDDSTEDSTAEEELYESPLTLYPTDEAYYRDLVDALTEGEKPLIPYEALHWAEGNGPKPIPQLEVKVTPELREVLYDLPREVPAESGYYLLCQDKAVLDQGISDSRKSESGGWSKFSPLYDLNPFVEYLSSKYLATQSRREAYVAQLPSLEPGTAYYLFYGSIANRLEQSLVSEFFLVPIQLSTGALFGKPISLREFLSAYPISTSALEPGRTDDLERLSESLPLAMGMAQQVYLSEQRSREAAKRERQKHDYEERLQHWVRGGEQELDLSLPAEAIDTTHRPGSRLREARYQRALEEIRHTSELDSQYYRDFYTLDETQNAYLELLCVLYRAD